MVKGHVPVILSRAWEGAQPGWAGRCPRSPGGPKRLPGVCVVGTPSSRPILPCQWPLAVCWQLFSFENLKACVSLGGVKVQSQ